MANKSLSTNGLFCCMPSGLSYKYIQARTSYLRSNFYLKVWSFVNCIVAWVRTEYKSMCVCIYVCIYISMSAHVWTCLHMWSVVELKYVDDVWCLWKKESGCVWAIYWLPNHQSTLQNQTNQYTLVHLRFISSAGELFFMTYPSWKMRASKWPSYQS